MKFNLVESLIKESFGSVLKDEFKMVYDALDDLDNSIYVLVEKIKEEYPEIDAETYLSDLIHIPYNNKQIIRDTMEYIDSSFNEELVIDESLLEYFADNTNTNNNVLPELKEVRDGITKVKETLAKSPQAVDKRIGDLLVTLENKINNLGKTLQSSVKESLDEDIVIPTVEMEPVTVNEVEPETPTPGVENGLASIIMALIKDEYDAIEGYNNAIANAKEYGYEDLVTVFSSLANEEMVHVGELQKALEIVSPNVAKIKEGEVEAEEHIEDDDVNDDGTLDWSMTESLLKKMDPKENINE